MSQSTRDEEYVQRFLTRFQGKWSAWPDLRFAQLVNHVISFGTSGGGQQTGVATVTDAEFLQRLDKWGARPGIYSGGQAPRQETSGGLELTNEEIEDYAQAANKTWNKLALEKFGRIGRDPDRIEPFLELLANVWLQYPSKSFGELVAALTQWSRTGEHRRRRAITSELHLPKGDSSANDRIVDLEDDLLCQALKALEPIS